MSIEKSATEQEGFLSRWSRKKLDPQDESSTTSAAEQAAFEPPVTDDVPPETVTETAETKPIWQRDDVDESSKLAALRNLFRKAEFQQLDGLNEYDDDFTQFPSLGKVVTHEMKRMLKLAEEKVLNAEPKAELAQDTAPNAEPKLAEAEPIQHDNEDKPIA
jgi:hypothetical protein